MPNVNGTLAYDPTVAIICLHAYSAMECIGAGRCFAQAAAILPFHGSGVVCNSLVEIVILSLYCYTCYKTEQ